ncbi:hypothetical protein GT347_15935 [Xylophilus rhododendri]|uniref:Uncharacterized protein n=2 Tax=Xylophilus rhododendri TaxID=2697032 RepID=A0A857J996_9BURK|nr:hypothetical protein GT347_15935 [Xylophilus rhododendri]
MNGLRKPRRPRPVSTNPMLLAMTRATLLTKPEIDATLEPVRAGFKALREGVANEGQWTHVVSVMNIADTIELQGVVRGARAHIQAAQLALAEIRMRAMASGHWKPTALYYQELDNIDAGVDLFAFQLSQLSHGEYWRALDRAIAEVRSSGGTVQIHPAGYQLSIEGA